MSTSCLSCSINPAINSMPRFIHISNSYLNECYYFAVEITRSNHMDAQFGSEILFLKIFEITEKMATE
ncbi:hypothetical protein BRADI_4g25243v3 [Brachypodium distachyon]|uniref:Uncharacterized protein n=1 Tax=Brachypodium distachyon TaxID=15368 RepID=A0A2K2CQ86_BRADI|nr:hypothetical protein BRADI_4g25243v3 [Brachypodium distachyon]